MQEKIEKGIGWLQKLLHLQEKFIYPTNHGICRIFCPESSLPARQNGTGANRATQRRCITPYECRCKYTDDI